MAAIAALGLLFLVLFLSCHEARNQRDRHPQHCWSTYKVNRSKPAKVQQRCFENKCLCDDVSVDCSYSNISYVPRVRHRVEVLNLSNNNYGNISDSAFFTNLSGIVHVRGLDLSNNDLAEIVFGHLNRYKRLERIFLGGNRLTYEQLDHVLCMPRLRSVELKCGRLGNIPRNFFANRSCRQLRYIDMSWNAIDVLDMEEFQPLGLLENLFLRYNKIGNVASADHPSLKRWIMHWNKLSDFPETCDRNGVSLYPNLTVLDLNFNWISHLSDQVCLPSLTNLSLNFNTMNVFYKDMFSLQKFPSLKKLGLTQMRTKIRTMDEFTFNNSNILAIDFGHNKINFSSPSFSKDVFRGSAHLKKMFLDGNNFADVDNELFQSLFYHLASSLEVLFLGKTGLKLKGDTFENLTHLRQLYLYENGLRSIPDGSFDHLVNLTVLKLSANQITTVTPSMFSDDTRNRLKHIDLSNNPFACDCGIRHLQQWMLDQPTKFQSYKQKGYKCQSKDEKATSLETFSVSSLACAVHRLSPSTLLLHFVIDVVIAVIIVIIGIRFTMGIYPWDLFGYRRPCLNAEGKNKRFMYHVYVAYDEGNSDWVREELCKVLEVEWRLRVCIHEKDFHPGSNEVASIDNALSNSYCTLVILSQCFAKNRQHELEIYNDQAMTTSRPLVVVRMPDMGRVEAASFRSVLRRAIWLDWQEEEENAVRAFCILVFKNLGAVLDQIGIRLPGKREGRPFWKKKFWNSLSKALRGAREKAKEDRQRRRQ